MFIRFTFLVVSCLIDFNLSAQTLSKPTPVEQMASEVEVVEICFCDSEAEFPGGESAMVEYFSSAFASRNLSAFAQEENQTVWVQFIVRENGDTDSFEFLKTYDPALKSVVIDIINKMPPWKPYNECGTNFAVKVRIPISIQITG